MSRLEYWFQLLFLKYYFNIWVYKERYVGFFISIVCIIILIILISAEVQVTNVLKWLAESKSLFWKWLFPKLEIIISLLFTSRLSLVFYQHWNACSACLREAEESENKDCPITSRMTHLFTSVTRGLKNKFNLPFLFVV